MTTTTMRARYNKHYTDTGDSPWRITVRAAPAAAMAAVAYDGYEYEYEYGCGRGTTRGLPHHTIRIR